MGQLRALFSGFDIWLFSGVLALTLFGLVTMYSHAGENIFFNRQIWWIVIATVTLFLAMVPDYRQLRSGNTTFFLYLTIVALLILVLFIGEITLGAQSRFNLGFF